MQRHRWDLRTVHVLAGVEADTPTGTDRFGRPLYVCRVCETDERARFGPHSRTTCLACKRDIKRNGARIKANQYALPPLHLPQCRECGLKHTAVRLGLCGYCVREKNGERLHATNTNQWVVDNSLPSPLRGEQVYPQPQTCGGTDAA